MTRNAVSFLSIGTFFIFLILTNGTFASASGFCQSGLDDFCVYDCETGELTGQGPTGTDCSARGCSQNAILGGFGCGLKMATTSNIAYNDKSADEDYLKMLSLRKELKEAKNVRARLIEDSLEKYYKELLRVNPNNYAANWGLATIYKNRLRDGEKITSDGHQTDILAYEHYFSAIHIVFEDNPQKADEFTANIAKDLFPIILSIPSSSSESFVPITVSSYFNAVRAETDGQLKDLRDSLSEQQQSVYTGSEGKITLISFFSGPNIQNKIKEMLRF